MVRVIDRRIIWHDVENGSYAADLSLWLRLADAAAGPILDLGAGTGRVALELAAAGHEVTALESDPLLLDELGRRARERELSIARWNADARALTPMARFALVIAPMQFLQIMGGVAERSELIERAAACLVSGGAFAAAISDLDEAVAVDDAMPPLPDVGERRGWVYSSLPLDVRPEPGGVAVEWLRQVVSPAGELTEERNSLKLDSLSPEQLEREAEAQGLRAEARYEIDATESHIGSTVIVCRR
jgi:SAM-dependent methyltransferase